MRLRNSNDRWGGIAQLLHWGMAVLVVGMFPLGWYMVGLPLGPAKLDYYSWHKSFGITILVLVALRLAWRLANPTPQLPGDTPRWERGAAHASHVLLYALLVALPVAGYVINSAANFPLSVFGWFSIPNVIAESESLKESATLVHQVLGWVLLAVLAVHVAAALRHHVILRDDVLLRMLPGARRGHESS